MSGAVRLPDGRRVQIWQGGSDEGPVVLFMHGCPDSRWAAWPGGSPAERAGVRLVAANRPGYGGSDLHAFTPRTVADDAIAVADALGVAHVAVLGMSVGGIHALATAACHADRVTAVLTVSAPGQVTEMDPPHSRDSATPEELAELEVLRSTRTVEDAAEVLRPRYEAFRARLRGDGRAGPELVTRWTAELDDPDRRLMRAVPQAVLALQAQEALVRSEAYLRDAAALLRPWAFDVSGIRCPVTVVHGGRDRQASPRNARWLADSVPGAEAEVKPDDTHLAALHRHWDEHLSRLRRSQADRSTSPEGSP